MTGCFLRHTWRPYPSRRTPSGGNTTCHVPSRETPTTFVGMVGDQVRAFATVGASRDTDAEISTGELWAMCVHPDV